MGKTFKQDEGVAGLTILLSLVVMLFVIGLLVMIFAIMSGKMADTDSLYSRSGTNTVTTESVTPITAGTNLANYDKRGVLCELGGITNGTAGGIYITAGNYTEISECKLANLTSAFTTAVWKVNYTYTYLVDTSGAVATINDTSSAVSSVTDWFDIFIVIGAMVVLILLTVIIITAIKSSGMIAEAGSPQGANQVGTA